MAADQEDRSNLVVIVSSTVLPKASCVPGGGNIATTVSGGAAVGACSTISRLSCPSTVPPQHPEAFGNDGEAGRWGQATGPPEVRPGQLRATGIRTSVNDRALSGRSN